METILKLNSPNSMKAQVARSKGTEWMVSEYYSWQQHSPLKNKPEKKSSTFLRLVSRMALGDIRPNSALALTLRSIVLIIGLIISVKSS